MAVIAIIGAVLSTAVLFAGISSAREPEGELEAAALLDEVTRRTRPPKAR